MEVKLRDINRSAASLRKLADTPKMPPALFIKFANAWRDVSAQLEIVQKSIDAIISDNSKWVTVNGQSVTQYIDHEHKDQSEEQIRIALDQLVELPHVKSVIKWKAIEDAKIEALTPFDVAMLDWLIEQPEDSE